MSAFLQGYVLALPGSHLFVAETFWRISMTMRIQKLLELEAILSKRRRFPGTDALLKKHLDEECDELLDGLRDVMGEKN